MKLELTDISNIDEFDSEDQNGDELFTFGKKVKIEIGDMDYKSWRYSLVKDRDILELLTLMVGDITPKYDSKLQELFRVIRNKLENPINQDNKKIIIFTAFADTAEYLFDKQICKGEFRTQYSDGIGFCRGPHHSSEAEKRFEYGIDLFLSDI